MEKTDATTMMRLGLDQGKLHGQCYDGCSTMIGKKKGVATLIKCAVQALALSTHCYTEFGMWGLDQKFYHHLKFIGYVV